MTYTRGIGLRYLLLMGILLLTVATGAPAAFIPLTATLTGAQETSPNSSTGIGSPPSSWTMSTGP